MKRITRRHFLAAGIAVGASSAVDATLAELMPRSRGRRVVIVGGGWGGLTAARYLRDLAPELEVVLVERSATFRSLPLSNKWLAGLAPEAGAGYSYLAAARAYGYTFIQDEATAIDRERRRVITRGGTLDYDWLVLAVGIRYDYAPWFGDDRRAADQARQSFPAGFVADELDALKRKLAGFQGGDFVMTIPPAPYRCTPAPYERAVMIAWLFKQKNIKGRLIVVDPGAGMQAFNRVFADRYKDWIVHLTHANVKSIDPFSKTIVTEFDDLRFDDGMLMPAQQAGDLAWQAGLIARDSDGRATGWGALDPIHLHARDDDRVFLVGDLIDKVSPLFGFYPKSGHLANRLGRIAAREIAARARGELPEPLLPESICHVFPDVEPLERIRIDAQYRLRGDGIIAQTVRQHYDPQPRGEDVEWAQSMYADFLVPGGGPAAQ
ncbi:MAG: pyridine nucleotide-disulfide oxidoreductase [Rhodocyclales bacterium RIFCSPLOWO2_02_FULL_63_24]|nr:MAG: pyridine nucleotide-disulfide oxidoreductase [Rhodocyclales bacterium GWA2_65_19]OHC72099.1 MAG: pyridine nucleotide-disulfide oxidoreductase [Rhodocyclales bacterium RIFCSPLOWO2_02_FULL_63_24]